MTTFFLDPQRARRGMSIVLFFGSAVIAATAISAVAWRYLPYEDLERFSPEDRFFVWEGVVWLVALLCVFLGASAILETMGWRLRAAVAELLRRLDARDAGAPLLNPGTVPWWLLTSGMLLILIGSLARVFMLP